MANVGTPVPGDAGRYRSITVAERRLYGLNETGDVLNVSRSTVHNLVSDGELEAVRVGRRLLITVESIDAHGRCVGAPISTPIFPRKRCRHRS